MSTLSIAVSGLNAAMLGMTTTSNNIANQATPGYNRQVVVQGTNGSLLTGAGFVGQGTHVETVKRLYSEYLSQQVLSAQSSASEMDAYYQQISQIDNMLGDATTGVGSAISGFFAGVQSVVASPSSISARQSMLSTAQTLVSRFQSLDQRLSEIRDGVNAQITSQVAAISDYAKEIAVLNDRIVLAQAGNYNQAPNDLLDQRDQLISEVNKLVRVDTVTQGDGTVNLFFGNGQPLVVGSQAYSLTAGPANEDPNKIVVKLQISASASIEIPESQITGGTLGGLIEFRTNSLDNAQNSLGRIAVAMTQTFNAQHALGQDLNGNIGGDFFSIPQTVGAIANRTNTGTAQASITFNDTAAANLTASDYRLSYDGAAYTLTRLSDGKSWSNASLATLSTTAAQGFDISTTAVPASGDSFLIRPTRAAASSLAMAITDPRDIAAASPIVTSSTATNTGTASITSSAAVDTTNTALRNTATIRFDTPPTNYTITDTVTGTTATGTYDPTTGGDITFNGWTVHITGTPKTNDVFTVSSNVSGVSDGRNAVALANLQTSKTMTGGTASYLESYSQLVSDIGNKTREVKAVGASQTALANSAVASQQELSGVNLDEEAANLIRYQQAYQASAKVIEISSKLFDSIIALG